MSRWEVISNQIALSCYKRPVNSGKPFLSCSQNNVPPSRFDQDQTNRLPVGSLCKPNTCLPATSLSKPDQFCNASAGLELGPKYCLPERLLFKPIHPSHSRGLFKPDTCLKTTGQWSGPSHFPAASPFVLYPNEMCLSSASLWLNTNYLPFNMLSV